jgi:predicted PurR-regulated permease PerM
MEFRDHLRTTGGALKNWLIAQSMDAAAVAALWFIGLLIIGVPWAILWAVIAGIMQFVPHIGTILGMVPAVLAALFSDNGEPLYGFLPERVLYVLILYAAIVVIDGLVLQPYFMKRTTRVPIWASIITPLVLGILLPVWGVVLAAPLLAVIYAYRARRKGRPAEVIPFPPDRRVG